MFKFSKRKATPLEPNLDEMTTWERAQYKRKQQLASQANHVKETKTPKTPRAPKTRPLAEAKSEPSTTEKAPKTKKVKQKQPHPKRPKAKKTRSTNLFQLSTGLLVIIIFFACTALASLYACLPVSRVQSVTVDTNSPYLQQEIVQASGIHQNEFLLPIIFHKKKIEAKVAKKVPAIKKVQLKRQNNKLMFKVACAKVMGYLKANNSKYYPVTTAGTKIDRSLTKVQTTKPIFYGFGKHPTILQKTVQTYQGFSAKLQQSIAEIHFEPTKIEPTRLRLFMNDGNQVVVNLKTFKQNMKYYPMIAADMKHKGVVNLEVGAYSYSYKNPTQTAGNPHDLGAEKAKLKTLTLVPKP